MRAPQGGVRAGQGSADQLTDVVAVVVVVAVAVVVVAVVVAVAVAVVVADEQTINREIMNNKQQQLLTTATLFPC